MAILSFDYSANELAKLDKLRSYLNIANRILSARVALGLTQGDVGEAAGSKQSKISELEAMKGNPRLDTLDRIAKVLGLAVDLVPRSEEPTGLGSVPSRYRAKSTVFEYPVTVLASAPNAQPNEVTPSLAQ